MTGLIFAFRALLYAQSLNLTGTYMADDGGVYYVQQSGSTLWWAGMSLDSDLSADLQWHRGLNFTNVFRGTINSDNTIVGDWSDVTRGTILQSGTLTVKIGSSGGAIQLTKVTATPIHWMIPRSMERPGTSSPDSVQSTRMMTRHCLIPT